MNGNRKERLFILTNYITPKEGLFMLTNYITPNDDGIMSTYDSQSIQNAVDKAKATGINRVVIPRLNGRTGKNQWDISEAIILTSDIEIILDNCYLRQEDGSMDNVFRNYPQDCPNCTIEGEQENIRIIGYGNAVIDGGNPNGLEEFTSLKNGLPHISRNNPILLHNIRGLIIENITIKNPRWWGINLLYVEKARLSNITIDAQNNMRNQDGIDLRIGCHDIILENIFGQAGDDLIALSGFWGGRECKVWGVEEKDRDIHDVVIKNVIGTSAECTIVALRNNDGVKLYNITVDGVYDTLNGIKNKNPENGNVFSERLQWKRQGAKTPYTVIRIGQDAFFRERPNKLGEVYAITVKNIHARCNDPIMLNVTVEKSYFGNIYAGSDARCLLSTKSDYDSQNFGADMRDVVFENLYYTDSDREDAVAFDLAVTGEKRSFKNVVIKNAFVGNCIKLLNMEHNGQIVFDGLYTENIEERIENKANAQIMINGRKV